MKPRDLGASGKPGHCCWGSSGRPLPSLCPGPLSTSSLLLPPVFPIWISPAVSSPSVLLVALPHPLGKAWAQRNQHSRAIMTSEHFQIILSTLNSSLSSYGPRTGALKDHAFPSIVSCAHVEKSPCCRTGGDWLSWLLLNLKNHLRV